MAGHFGTAERLKIAQTPDTEVHMMRIHAAANIGVWIESLIYSFDFLGTEEPIEIIHKFNPGTPGTDGTTIVVQPMQPGDATVFDVDVDEDASGQSGYTQERHFFVGPGGIIVIPNQKLVTLRGGDLVDIFYKQKLGGAAALLGSLSVELHE